MKPYRVINKFNIFYHVTPRSVKRIMFDGRHETGTGLRLLDYPIRLALTLDKVR